jgi:hypothetical protein
VNLFDVKCYRTLDCESLNEARFLNIFVCFLALSVMEFPACYRISSLCISCPWTLQTVTLLGCFG